MKIIYIIDSLIIAGAQMHLLRLLDGINDRRNIESKLICLGPVDSLLKDKIETDCIECIDMSSIRNGLTFIKGLFQLVAAIKKEKPDIVHTYLNTSNIFGLLAAKLSKVKIILTSRRDMGHFRTSFIGILERLSNQFVHQILCVSNAVAEQTVSMENVNKEKVKVLYTGVDSNHFRKENIDRKSDIIHIGVVAAINREIKGHRLFIQSALKVIESVQNVKFVLIGDGALRAGLEKMVQKQGKEQFFEFAGSKKDVKEELSKLDLFVLPSLSEGFSNAILEAMSMELPVIAFDLEGNKEIVDNGENGFLTPPEDIDGMAVKMIELIKNQDKMIEMGQKSRKKVLDLFTIEHMINRYEKFYKSLKEKK